MKQISYLILGALAWLVSACNPVQDQVFDKSASERVEVAIQSVTKTLKAAPKGWNMQLFTGKVQPYGGYNLIVDFSTDDQVTVYNPLVDNGQGVTSLYTVKQCGGVLLSFDTYNKAMHYFSDPINPDELGAGVGKGLEGDLEYVVMEESADRIVLCGLKSERYAVLTRLADDVVPADYLKQLTDMQTLFDAPRYVLYVNGEKISKVSRYENYLEGAVKVDGDMVTLSLPFVFTKEGLRLYEAVGFDALGKGQLMTNFKFDAEKDGMVCTDAGVDVLIKKDFPGFNEKFVDTPTIFSFGGDPTGKNTEFLSPAFAADFTKAITTYAAEGQSALLCLFGRGNKIFKNTDDFIFLLYGPYHEDEDPGIFIWGLTLQYIEGTTDQITFVNKYNIQDIEKVPVTDAFMAKLVEKGPYKLTTDDENNPTVVRVESVSDANYWFVLGKYK